MAAVKTAILTVSTSVSRRESEDATGPLLAALAEDAGCEIVAMEVVPDDFALIEDRLHHFVGHGVASSSPTGGTGLTPDDVTPEATARVIEREAPASPRRCGPTSMRHTPLAMLSRGLAGHRRAAR